MTQRDLFTVRPERFAELRRELQNAPGPVTKPACTGRSCDDCGKPADPQLIAPMCALCFDCWDGNETPIETIDRLKTGERELQKILGDALERGGAS